jgi:ubiquinone/menaquinone biosynthesis C-methylase UbiE
MPEYKNMKQPEAYVLGQSAHAARRLEIQDAQFGDASEQLLDDLALRPNDRVVEFGCGPGSFSRRILRRLGAGGVLVGVDSSEALLTHARGVLDKLGPARFEPVLADIAQLGTWLENADVVVARAVLHHVPMVEILLGRLRARLKPGTRVGFLEPDFRTRLARLAYHEATGRPELAPLGVWATAISQLYQLRRLSPDIGPMLAPALETAGFHNVRAHRSECPWDETVIENLVMFYDEVRDTLQALGILSAEETERQQQLLRALPFDSLPAVWGICRVACEA